MDPEERQRKLVAARAKLAHFRQRKARAGATDPQKKTAKRTGSSLTTSKPTVQSETLQTGDEPLAISTQETLSSDVDGEEEQQGMLGDMEVTDGCNDVALLLKDTGHDQLLELQKAVEKRNDIISQLCMNLQLALESREEVQLDAQQLSEQIKALQQQLHQYSRDHQQLLVQKDLELTELHERLALKPSDVSDTQAEEGSERLHSLIAKLQVERDGAARLVGQLEEQLREVRDSSTRQEAEKEALHAELQDLQGQLEQETLNRRKQFEVELGKYELRLQTLEEEKQMEQMQLLEAHEVELRRLQVEYNQELQRLQDMHKQESQDASTDVSFNSGQGQLMEKYLVTATLQHVSSPGDSLDELVLHQEEEEDLARQLQVIQDELHRTEEELQEARDRWSLVTEELQAERHERLRCQELLNQRSQEGDEMQDGEKERAELESRLLCLQQNLCNAEEGLRQAAEEKAELQVQIGNLENTLVSQREELCMREAEVLQRHQEEVLHLQESHAEEVHSLQEDTKKQLSELKGAVEEEHRRQISLIKQVHEREQQRERAQLKVELQESMEAAHQAELLQMQVGHSLELEALRLSLSEQQSAQLELSQTNLQREQERALSELQSILRERWAQESAILQARHQREIQAEREHHQLELDDLRRAYDSKLQQPDMEQKKDLEMKARWEEINSLRAELQVLHTSRQQELQRMEEDLNQAWLDRDAAARAVEELVSSHSTVLQELRAHSLQLEEQLLSATKKEKQLQQKVEEMQGEGSDLKCRSQRESSELWSQLESMRSSSEEKGELREQLLACSSQAEDMERVKQQFSQEKQDIQKKHEHELENLRGYFEEQLSMVEERHREERELLEMRLLAGALDETVTKTRDASSVFEKGVEDRQELLTDICSLKGNEENQRAVLEDRQGQDFANQLLQDREELTERNLSEIQQLKNRHALEVEQLNGKLTDESFEEISRLQDLHSQNAVRQDLLQGHIHSLETHLGHLAEDHAAEIKQLRVASMKEKQTAYSALEQCVLRLELLEVALQRKCEEELQTRWQKKEAELRVQFTAEREQFESRMLSNMDTLETSYLAEIQFIRDSHEEELQAAREQLRKELLHVHMDKFSAMAAELKQLHEDELRETLAEQKSVLQKEQEEALGVLREQVLALEEQHKAALGELMELHKAELQELRGASPSKLSALHQELENTEQKRVKLEEEVIQLRELEQHNHTLQQTEDLKQQLYQLNKEISVLRSEASSLQVELQGKCAEMFTLETLLQRREREIQEGGNLLSMLRTDLGAATEDRKCLQDSQQQLQQVLVDMLRIITETEELIGHRVGQCMNSGAGDTSWEGPDCSLMDEGMDLSHKLSQSLFFSSLEIEGNVQQLAVDTCERLRTAVDQLLQLVSKSAHQLKQTQDVQQRMQQEFSEGRERTEQLVLQHKQLLEQLSLESSMKNELELQLHKSEGLNEGYLAEKALLEEAVQQKESREQQLVEELEALRAQLEQIREEQTLVLRQKEALAGALGEAETGLLAEVQRLAQEKEDLQRQAEKDQGVLVSRLKLLENELEEQEVRAQQLEEQQRTQTEDLKQQVQALEKQLKQNRHFIDEQAVEREHERDEFQQEIRKLEFQLRYPGKPHTATAASGQRTEELLAEVEMLQAAIKDKTEDYNTLLLAKEQYERDVAEQNEEIDKMASRIRELEQALLTSAESQRTLIQLEQELQKARQVEQELLQDRDSLQKQQLTSRMQLSALQSKLDETRHRLPESGTEETMRLHLEAVQQELLCRDRQIESLEQKLDLMHGELLVKKQEVHQLHLQLELMSQQNSENVLHLENQLSCLQEELSSFRDNDPTSSVHLDLELLNEKNQEIDHLNEQLLHLQQEFDKSKNEVLQQAQLEDLRSQVELLLSDQQRMRQDKEEELEQLHEVIQKLQNELVKLGPSQLEMSDIHENNLARECVHAAGATDNLGNELQKQLNSENHILHAELGSELAAREELHLVLRESQDRIQLLETTNRELFEERQAMRQREGRLQEEIERLRQDVTSYTIHIQDLKVQLEDGADQKEVLTCAEVTLAKAEDALQEKERQLTQLQNEVEVQRTELKLLRVELASLKEALSSSTEKAEKLLEDSEIKDGALAELKVVNQHLKAELCSLQAELTAQEEELKYQQHTLEQLRQDSGRQGTEPEPARNFLQMLSHEGTPEILRQQEHSTDLVVELSELSILHCTSLELHSKDPSQPLDSLTLQTDTPRSCSPGSPSQSDRPSLLNSLVAAKVKQLETLEQTPSYSQACSASSLSIRDWVSDGYGSNVSSELGAKLQLEIEATERLDAGFVQYLRDRGMALAESEVPSEGGSDEVLSTELQGLLKKVHQEACRILVLSQNGLDLAPTGWREERRALQEAVLSLRELLFKVVDMKEKTEAGEEVCRSELIQAVRSLFVSERDWLLSELREVINAHVMSDLAPLMELVERRLREQEEHQQQSLEKLFSADRHSLLTELQNLQLRVSNVPNQERTQQLEGTLSTMQVEVDQLQHCKKVELLEVQLQQEKFTTLELRSTLQEEQTTVQKLRELMQKEQASMEVLNESLKKEWATLQELRESLHEEKLTSQELRGLLQKEQKTVQELRGSLHEEQNTVKELRGSLHEEMNTLQELRGSLHEEQKTVKGLRGSLHEEQKTVQELRRSLHEEQKTVQETAQVLRESLHKEQKTAQELRELLNEEQKTVQQLQESLHEEQKTVQKLRGSLHEEQETLQKEQATQKELQELLKKEQAGVKELFCLLQKEQNHNNALSKQLDDKSQQISTTCLAEQKLQSEVLELRSSLENEKKLCLMLKQMQEQSRREDVTMHNELVSLRRQIKLQQERILEMELEAQEQTRVSAQDRQLLQELRSHLEQERRQSEGMAGMIQEGARQQEELHQQLQLLKEKSRAQQEQKSLQKSQHAERERWNQGDGEQLLEQHQWNHNHKQHLQKSLEQQQGAAAKLNVIQQKLRLVSGRLKEILHSTSDRGRRDGDVQWDDEFQKLLHVLTELHWDLQQLTTQGLSECLLGNTTEEHLLMKQVSAVAKSHQQEKQRWQQERTTLEEAVRDARSCNSSKMERLYGRYLRAESFRKALVYQKRYLLLLLGGFQDCEQATLCLVSRMGTQPVPVDLQGYQRRPIQRFRTAVRVVVAVARLRFLVRKWNRAVRKASLPGVKGHGPTLRSIASSRPRPAATCISPPTHERSLSHRGVSTLRMPVPLQSSGDPPLSCQDPERSLSEYIRHLEAVQQRLGTTCTGTT